MIKKVPQKRGAVLLIAILVGSVALAVGLGVYNRTYKELLFASFWKQTQVAFSAADSGLECALYWLLNPGAPVCFGQGVGVAWVPPGTGSFEVDIVNGVGPCVKVDIVGTGVSTTTTARGYNVSCTDLGLGTNPRIVERGLRVGI